jgi:uncharacterized membrane protein
MRNKIFAYVVLGLNVIAAWISWAVLAAVIFGKTEHVWLYPILAFSFWGIFFTLSAIFVKGKKYFHPSLLAGALGYPVFFGINLSALGMLAALLLLILTENQTKKEIERGVKISFHHLVSHTLKYFVTAICVVIAIAYYFSIAEKPDPSPTLLEKRTLETEMDWGLKAAELVLPEEKRALVDDITGNMNVDEFLSKNFIEPEIGNAARMVNTASDATQLIGDAAAAKIHEQMLDKSKQDLAKQLGVNVVGDQAMKEVLMAYIEKTQKSFFEYSGSDKFYIPVILAFGLFLTARVLGTAIDIFLGLLILGIIKLLRTFEIVQIKTEQKEVAVIEYSV